MDNKRKRHAMTIDQERRLYGLTLYIRELTDLKRATERKRHGEEMLEVLELLTGENMRREAILEVFELFFGERANKETTISDYIKDRKASVLERIERAKCDIESARDNIRKIIPIMNGEIVIGWGSDQNFRGVTYTSMVSLMKKIVNKEIITENDLDLGSD